jgi:hypothetical protein
MLSRSRLDLVLARLATWLGHEGATVSLRRSRSDEMSGSSTRSMTFQATPAEVFSALQEAARRTGLLYLSGDVSNGIAIFTSGRFLLGFGEKVTARMKQAAPGTVQVTLSSDPKFGVFGRSDQRDLRAERMSDALSGLLPHSG